VHTADHDPLRSIRSALEAGLLPTSSSHAASTEPCPARFVTISRQAGAGGRTLASDLADAINALKCHPDPWTAWDQALVDRVAAEHQLDKRSIEMLETSRPTWFGEFVDALSSTDLPSEFKVYRRVAITIRALATAGGAIIVGRGGVFITRGLPGSVHVRLVAPVDYREKRLAERLGVPQKEAARNVREIDHGRESFYQRYWPGKALSPESFTVTLNTAAMTGPQMVSCLLPIIVSGLRVSPPSASALRADSHREVPRDG